jgi:hypothetical protein
LCLRNLFWSQLHQQFSRWSNDSPPWLMSALCQWHQHFSLLTVSRNTGHCPLKCCHLKTVEPVFECPPLHHHWKPAEFCGLFPLRCPQVSDKIWCSITALSVLSSWAKRECVEHVLHHFAIWQRETWWCGAAKKSRMLLPMCSVPHPFTITFRGKNIVGYFLDRLCTYKQIGLTDHLSCFLIFSFRETCICSF